MLKILVADDELLAQQNLAVLLASRPEVSDIKYAKDGKQTLDIFANFAPDILFLDIEMPGKTGIEVANQIGDKTTIVFVTAYDQYAISAFEINAIDYLLKPYDDNRFNQAFDRAKNHCQLQKRIDYTQLGELFDTMLEERESRFKSRLVIKDLGRIRLVQVDEVNYFLGSGNYVEIHMQDDSSILHRETMASVENQLNPKDFVRIHRSSIVRVSFIKELLPNERGDYKVKLKNDLELTVSRANKFKLLQFIRDE